MKEEGTRELDTLDRTLADSDNTKGTTGTTCIYKHCHYLEETQGQRLPYQPARESQETVAQMLEAKQLLSFER